MISITVKAIIIVLVGVLIINSLRKWLILGFLLALLEMIFIENSID